MKERPLMSNYTTHFVPTEPVRRKTYTEKKNELDVCRVQMKELLLQMKAKDDEIAELLLTIKKQDAEIEFDRKTREELIDTIQKRKKQIVRLHAEVQFDRKTRADMSLSIRKMNERIRQLRKQLNNLKK